MKKPYFILIILLLSIYAKGGDYKRAESSRQAIGVSVITPANTTWLYKYDLKVIPSLFYLKNQNYIAIGIGKYLAQENDFEKTRSFYCGYKRLYKANEKVDFHIKTDFFFERFTEQWNKQLTFSGNRKETVTYLGKYNYLRALPGIGVGYSLSNRFFVNTSLLYGLEFHSNSSDTENLSTGEQTSLTSGSLLSKSRSYAQLQISLSLILWEN